MARALKPFTAADQGRLTCLSPDWSTEGFSALPGLVERPIAVEGVVKAHAGQFATAVCLTMMSHARRALLAAAKALIPIFLHCCALATFDSCTRVVTLSKVTLTLEGGNVRGRRRPNPLKSAVNNSIIRSGGQAAHEHVSRSNRPVQIKLASAYEGVQSSNSRGRM